MGGKKWTWEEWSAVTRVGSSGPTSGLHHQRQGETRLLFFLLSLWRGNAIKDHKHLVKTLFSRQKYWGCEWSGDLSKIQQLHLCGSETRALSKNRGTLLDHLLCQISWEALTPYLISALQLPKVLLSSSFHWWRNWDSERLSNMLRVSQQVHGTGSQGF